MSAEQARVILFALFVPSVCAVYLVVLAVGLSVEWGRPSVGLDLHETSYRNASWSTILFAAGYWLLLWRRRVEWTPRRVMATAFAAGLCLITVVVLRRFFFLLMPPYGVLVATGAVILLWLMLTTLIWRDGEIRGATSRAGVAIA